MNRELLEFIGLTIAGPCLIYALVFQTLSIHTGGEGMTLAALAIAGAWIWASRNA